jgi:hypothetical protein
MLDDIVPSEWEQVKGPGEENIKSRFTYFSAVLSFEAISRQ